MSNSIPNCLIRVNSAAGSAATCIEADRFTIGRLGADFTIPDKGVSRVHLSVSIKNDEIWLEDLESANGTYLGGQKLPPRSPVLYKPGTPVQLGVGRDVVTFEVIGRAITQKAAEAAAAELEKHPSRSLSIAAPTEDLAKQADGFLREARNTAVGIRETAAREAEAVMNNARNKSNEMMAKARAEVDSLIERARNSASQATLDREAAAEQALADARKEALAIRSSADEEAERISKESRSAASQAKLQAQRESEELLRNARMTAASIKDQADVEAREIIKQARERNRIAIEKNEEELERALSESREAAARIRAEADELLEKARTYMRDKGEQVIQEATEQAERLRNEATADASRLRADALADAGRVRDEARAEGLQTIESGLREAEAEIRKVKEEAQAQIDELHAAQKRIEFEIEEVEKRKASLVEETEVHVREREEIEELLRESREALDNVRGEADRARADMTLAQTMRESAVKEREEAEQARRQAESDVEKLKREMEDKRNEAIREIKEIREKGLLEFEDRKKAEESQMASMKLKWLDEMKGRQLEEEKQARVLKTHQVVEMTRHLEMLLIPKIQNRAAEKDPTVFIAELKNELGPLVKRVILEEQQPQVASEIEQVISADPIIEKMKRREKLRSRAIIALPVCLFLLSIAMPEYFEPLRRPMDILTGGKTVEQMIAERRSRELASKKKFEPAMVEELGKTYSDSVLYTKNYIALKTDKENRKRWTVELEKFVYHDLGLPESVANAYVATEMAMVDQLIIQRAAINPEFEQEHIARLRKVEEEYLGELKGKVGGDVAYDKIRAFERRFFDSLPKPASDTP